MVSAASGALLQKDGTNVLPCILLIQAYYLVRTLDKLDGPKQEGKSLPCT